MAARGGGQGSTKIDKKTGKQKDAYSQNHGHCLFFV
jgi:hypothetical protein